MRKLIAIAALTLGLLGGSVATSSSASAKSLPKLTTSNITYASSKLGVKVKAPKAAKLVAVKYDQHVHYYKVKQNRATVSYKFTGYKTFELYGTTSKHHRVTQIKKITRQSYATTDVVNFSESRTTTDVTVGVQTLGSNRKVTLYSGGKGFQSINTGNSDHANFKLTLTQYQPKLSYTVAAKNKKTSLHFYLPYLSKPGNLDAIN